MKVDLFVAQLQATPLKLFDEIISSNFIFSRIDEMAEFLFDVYTHRMKNNVAPEFIQLQ